MDLAEGSPGWRNSANRWLQESFTNSTLCWSTTRTTQSVSRCLLEASLRFATWWCGTSHGSSTEKSSGIKLTVSRKQPLRLPSSVVETMTLFRTALSPPCLEEEITIWFHMALQPTYWELMTTTLSLMAKQGLRQNFFVSV